MKQLHHLLFVTLFFAYCTITPEAHSEILQEIRTGKSDKIRERRANGQDCSVTDPETGDNGNHIAAEKNDVEMLAALNSEPDYSGWNWFYYCIFSAGAGPNKDGKNKKGNTPLQSALDADNPEAAEYLIEKNVNTRNINPTGLPAIFVVVNKLDKKDKRVKRLLLNQKLLPQHFNGENALGYAMKRGNVIATKELVTKTNLADQQNEYGETGAIVASKLPNTQMLELLNDKGINFNAPGKNGKRPIHHSSATGNYDTTKYLLEHRASLDVTDDNGNSPIQSAIAADSEQVVNLHIAHRVDLQHRNKDGLDAFAFAMEHGRINIAKRLKDQPNTDINSRDKFGRTSFYRATKNGKHGNMQELIKMGVNISIGDNNGNNPLHIVAKNDDLVSAKIILDKDRSLLNQMNKDGDTPLFIAAQNGRTATVRLLISKGAPADQKNKLGESFYHQLAKSNNVTLLDEELRKQNNGFAVNSKDNNSSNIAHAAASSGSYDTVKYLKQNAPHLFTERNAQSNTPFIVARDLKTCQLLYDKKHFTNGDIAKAIKWSQDNKHSDVYTFLKGEHNKRCDEWQQLNYHYRSTKSYIEDNNDLHKKLCDKNGLFVISYALYTPSQLQYYSEEEFYHMDDAQRAKIMNEHLTCLNNEMSYNRELMGHLNTVLAQEEQQKIARLQAEREAERERARKQQLADEAKQQAENAQLIAQQAAELSRLNTLKRENDAHNAQANEHKMLNEQHAMIKEYNEQNAILKEHNQQRDILKECNDQHAAINQHKENQTKNQQQAELEYWNQQKALNDAERARQEKHAHALEGQHIPANMQPSAPPAEDGVMIVTQEEGECCVCYEPDITVTTIPCKNCNKDTCSARLCQECHDTLLKRALNPTKCPTCNENTLEKKYKIFKKN